MGALVLTLSIVVSYETHNTIGTCGSYFHYTLLKTLQSRCAHQLTWLGVLRGISWEVGGGWDYKVRQYLPGPPLMLASPPRPRVHHPWPSSAC